MRLDRRVEKREPSPPASSIIEGLLEGVVVCQRETNVSVIGLDFGLK